MGTHGFAVGLPEDGRDTSEGPGGCGVEGPGGR
jgi:hypothetical protein